VKSVTMEPDKVDEEVVRGLRETRHYIDNERLYQDYVWFHGEYQKYKQGLIDEMPKMTEYMGEAFILIAQGYSNHHLFRGYTSSWKEDMIGNAIEACVRYTRAFNPSESRNPFAYITQTVRTAFIKKIKEEKTKQYIRYKLFVENGGFSAVQDDEDFAIMGGSVLSDQFVDALKFVDHFENSPAYGGKKPKAAVDEGSETTPPKVGLDAILED